MLDGTGNEITDPENLRNQFQTEFFYGLRQRKPKEHIECHETLQNDLCMLRIENCRKVESDDFSGSELESVIRSLKNGRSLKGHWGLYQGDFQTRWQIPHPLCLGNDGLHQEA